MGLACRAATEESHRAYQHRRPEKTALYTIVREHMATLFAEAERQSAYGFGYPQYVKREFESFLHCGQFCCGAARLRCPACGFERWVAFSCKGHAVCPSCVSRRMAERAAFLVENSLTQCTSFIASVYRLLVIDLSEGGSS